MEVDETAAAAETSDESGFDAGTEESTGGEQSQSSTPDLAGEIASLRETMESRMPAPADEPEELTGDFADALYDAASGDVPAGEEQQYGEDNLVGAGEQDGFANQNDLDSYIEAKVAERVDPYIASQMAQQQHTELNQLAERYPDIRKKETVDGIGQMLDPLARRTDNPEAIFTDPRLVELAYKAYRAEQASAGETPAEQARDRGATLETNAGVGEVEGEVSPESEVKQSILATRDRPDPYT